jgi:hypothetical protein
MGGTHAKHGHRHALRSSSAWQACLPALQAQQRLTSSKFGFMVRGSPNVDVKNCGTGGGHKAA